MIDLKELSHKDTVEVEGGTSIIEIVEPIIDWVKEWWRASF